MLRTGREAADDFDVREIADRRRRLRPSRQHANAVERVGGQLVRSGGKSVLLQHVRHDVEVDVVAEARRRVPRHRRRDFREERFQILAGELARETLVAERGAGRAAEVRAVAAGARGLVGGGAARGLRIGEDAVGNGFSGLLRGHHRNPRHNDNRNEEFGIPNLEFVRAIPNSKFQIPHWTVLHSPGCGGLTGCHATTPVRFVSRRNSLPFCVT